VFSVVDIEGKAAHSGGNFEAGISAIGEAAHKIVTIHALTDLKRGITLNVGLVQGGQSVNTTDSAVRLTHLPSGLVVICQDEKSQLKNKAKALKVLSARLLERQRAEQQASEAQERRAQVGSGDRSERIRTYNFPQNRLTDHRIGLTLYKLDAVVSGDLDELFTSLVSHYQAEALAQAEADKALAAVKAGKTLAELFPAEKAETNNPFGFAAETKPEAKESGELKASDENMGQLGTDAGLKKTIFELKAAGLVDRVVTAAREDIAEWLRERAEESEKIDGGCAGGQDNSRGRGAAAAGRWPHRQGR
jgi:hypothetical protein